MSLFYIPDSHHTRDFEQQEHFNLQEGIKTTQWLTHHSFVTKPSTAPPKVQASQSLFQITSLMQDVTLGINTEI